MTLTDYLETVDPALLTVASQLVGAALALATVCWGPAAMRLAWRGVAWPVRAVWRKPAGVFALPVAAIAAIPWATIVNSTCKDVCLDDGELIAVLIALICVQIFALVVFVASQFPRREAEREPVPQAAKGPTATGNQSVALPADARPIKSPEQQVREWREAYDACRAGTLNTGNGFVVKMDTDKSGYSLADSIDAAKYVGFATVTTTSRSEPIKGALDFGAIRASEASEARIAERVATAVDAKINGLPVAVVAKQLEEIVRRLDRTTEALLRQATRTDEQRTSKVAELIRRLKTALGHGEDEPIHHSRLIAEVASLVEQRDKRDADDAAMRDALGKMQRQTVVLSPRDPGPDDEVIDPAAIARARRWLNSARWANEK